MRVVAQHATGEVVPPMGRQMAATVLQAFHQCRAMDRLIVAPGKQLAPLFLGLAPALTVLIQSDGGRRQGWRARFDHARPGVAVAHRFGTDGGGHTRRATQHRVGQFALDPGAETQGCQADTCSRHHLQGIFSPVHHMKTLRRVMQRSRLWRCVRSVDMQLGARQLLADQGPDAVLHP